MNKNKSKIDEKCDNPLCDKGMNFEECELAILRNAVDINEKAQDELQKQQQLNITELSVIFNILEGFISRKKLLLYGGFAINAVLPQYDKFYDTKHDIPDYDFYSPNALEDAVELADLFFEKGYMDVEAKAGVHYGTYKIYVNFNSVADITLIDKTIFDNLQKEAIIINKIHFCPVNFLRRNIYKELSQPYGDITRWEKIFKRLNKLNKNFPLNNPYKCEEVDFQRKMDSSNLEKNELIYNTLRDTFIHIGAVFFGGYACSLYSQYMPIESRKIIEKIPDFDILYEDLEKGTQIAKEKLNMAGIYDVQIIKYDEIGEIIPKHYEIRVGKDTVAFIYEAVNCYSFNTITIKGREIKVASIDTILLFYFSFYYSSKPYYYKDRILCMIDILYKVEQENRLNQKGILKRFNASCIGKVINLISIKKIKTDKFIELKNKKKTREYHSWFLKYNPEKREKLPFIKKNKRFSLKRVPLYTKKYTYKRKHRVMPKNLEWIRKQQRQRKSVNNNLLKLLKI